MKRYLTSCLLSCFVAASMAQSWPTPLPEAKPGTRWWWLGSAVDKENLSNVHIVVDDGPLGLVVVTAA